MNTLKIDIWQIVLSSALALLIVLFSLRVKFLTISGALATFILAVLIFGLGGWTWAIPVLVFFFLSSFLSKAGKDRKEQFKDTFEKTGERDYLQVMANGGIGGILIIAYFYYPIIQIYYLYVLSLASAAADTWATEIGILLGRNTVKITTFKPVAPGISGGVSPQGTLAALFGSFIVSVSGWIMIPANLSKLNILAFLTFCGFLASVIDSFLGSLIQGQYQCRVCKKYTEKRVHCGQGTLLISGIKIVNNDFVNITSSLAALALFILLL